MNRIECDECEEKITPMIGETDMGVCAAPKLPEGECATGWLYGKLKLRGTKLCCVVLGFKVLCYSNTRHKTTSVYVWEL